MHDLCMSYDDRWHFRPQKQVGLARMFLYELQRLIASRRFVREQHENAEVFVSLVSPADGFNHVPFSCYIHLSLKSSIWLKLILILHAFPPIPVVSHPGIHQACC